MRPSLVLAALLAACSTTPSAPGAPASAALVAFDTGIPDRDGDGYDEPEDCDDGDPAIHPGADEICNGADDDCDGTIDQGALDEGTWYVDADLDGYGDPTATVLACWEEPGIVADDTDCDDGDAQVFPGATEVCNGVDDDCDTVVDQGAVDALPWYADADLDGWGDPATMVTACDAPAGHVDDGTDCDDGDAQVSPGATEVCNGVDDDCDTVVDQGALDEVPWNADADRDGYGDPTTTVLACAAPEGFVADGSDCDDGRADVNPGATEACDPDDVDEDCDGAADDADAQGATEKATFHADADADAYGAGTPILACDAPAGAVVDGTDCDDGRADVHPGATEVCDPANTDEDCDGAADDADAEGATEQATFHADADADGYGDAAPIVACDAPAGAVADGTDCDDGRTDVHPGATEVCDPANTDEDCDGAADDADAQGATEQATFHADADADGYGDAAPILACDAPAGAVVDGTDCNDADGAVSPGADEHCDATDEDCDGTVDDHPVDGATFYADADLDSYGDPAAAISGVCAAPDGYVGVAGDCDDADAAFHPGATEACTDPTDYNCDGTTGFADDDGDGTAACDDCDDQDGDVHPGADEVCNGVDDDCDGTVDQGATDAPTWFADADADGHGDADATTTACAAPDGFVDVDDDCDDADATVHPGATETCTDPVDRNCDGSVGLSDVDRDGAAACEDCDDHDATAFPGGTEVCDGADDDCDGEVDEGAIDVLDFHADADRDGYGDPDVTTSACTPPSGFVEDATDCDDADARFHPGARETCTDPNDYDCDGSTTYADVDADGTPACHDCDDGDAGVHPGAAEVCNGVDDDCSGTTDVNATDATTWYVDADDDGYADLDRSLRACAAPAGYVAVTTEDCNDQDDTVFPGAAEVTCDGLDQDCDGADEEDARGCVPADTDVDTDVPVDTDEPVDTDPGGPGPDTDPGATDTGLDTDTDTGGAGGSCGAGCTTQGPGGTLALLPLLAVLARRRRR